MAIPPEKSAAWERWQLWQKNATLVERWTPGDFAVDRVGWLDSTIRNGGWIEVLASSHDGHLEQVVSSLEAIGAHATLEILRACIACFPAGKMGDSRQERGSQIDSLNADHRARLDALGDEYYASNEDICALAMDFCEKTRSVS